LADRPAFLQCGLPEVLEDAAQTSRISSVMWVLTVLMTGIVARLMEPAASSDNRADSPNAT